MTPRRSSQPTVKPARFSRQWWWRQCHDLFWVVLATVLIWVYADMEFTDTQKVSATLRLSTGQPPSRTMVLLSPPEHKIRMELSGNRTALERFRTRLATGGAVLTVNVTQDYEAGDRAVPTKELLQKAADLQAQGITIKNVTPQVLPLKMDRLVRLSDVPVRLDYTGAVLEQPTPTATVDVLVRSSQADRLRQMLDARPGQPVLTTQRVDLKALEPGKEETLWADVLRAVDGITVQPEPASAAFTVQVKRTTSIKRLPVTVKILTPPQWAEAGNPSAPAMWEEFALKRQDASDWRIELSVRGPTAQLKEENIEAFIELTDNDRPLPDDDSWLPGKEVQVRFREGTRLELTQQPPELKLRLVRRSVTGTR